MDRLGRGDNQVSFKLQSVSMKIVTSLWHLETTIKDYRD